MALPPPGHGPGDDGGDAHQAPLAEGPDVERVGVVVSRVDQILDLLVGPQQRLAQRAHRRRLDRTDLELAHGLMPGSLSDASPAGAAEAPTPRPPAPAPAPPTPP